MLAFIYSFTMHTQTVNHYNKSPLFIHIYIFIYMYSYDSQSVVQLVQQLLSANGRSKNPVVILSKRLDVSATL